jgi:hypothetical protein
VSADLLAEKNVLQDPNKLGRLLDLFAVVVVVDPHPELDLVALQQRPDLLVFDVSDTYQYRIDPVTKAPLLGQQTAEDRLRVELAAEAAETELPQDQQIDVSAVYTGVIPIVYKAQRTLLASLFESIFLSFFMIAFVMAVLLRPWGEPVRPSNLLNLRGGLLSMLPNAFPIVIVFGSMGYLAVYDVKVDIGSMMTASVAMGIAVDDTIHFLNWYRYALADGATRQEAIMVAYRRCAKAMTQTTMIAGFGLFAFAFSSFTPTQRFGTLMLVLLVVALIGDLIFLPALISSPLGKYFGKELPASEREALAKKKQLETRVTNPDLIVSSLSAKQVVVEAAGPHSTTSRGSPKLTVD